MIVEYEGDFSSPSGYSRATRAHAEALLQAGIDLAITNKKKDPPLPSLAPYWAEKLSLLENRSRKDCKIKIWHETPPFYNPDPKIKNVAYLAWETSLLPTTWTPIINRMDQVWVPCTDNLEVLNRSGVTIPIHIVPHPIKVDNCQVPIAPKYKWPEEMLTLLSIFQWTTRKDPLSMLLGFYSRREPMRLLLKTHGASLDEGQGQIVNKIREIRNSFQATTLNSVFPCFDSLSDEEMPSLYRSAHAYITTSRGEGACLPALEAMAAGLPVVAPAHSAFLDFVDEDVGYPVECYPERVFGMTHSRWYTPDQYWYRVDDIDFSFRLYEVVEDYQSGRLAEKGLAARNLIAEQFNPKKIGMQMRSLLEQLL